MNAGRFRRFERVIIGREICGGFSELNTSDGQAARFQGQRKTKDVNNEDPMLYDKDYVKVLEDATSTPDEGIGIYGLVMLFTNSPAIRDVILFPQLLKE